MDTSKMIKVISASDWTLVIDKPEINLRRVWTKRGAAYPIDRDALEMAYYDPAVEALFKDGSLYTEDKEFMAAVGLLKEDETPVVQHIDETIMKRMISVMPLSEVKSKLKEMTTPQIAELAEYAIAHYSELKMDRIDLLSKVSGRPMLRAIENYKKDKEE